jgi:hypothetical protein
MSEIIFRGTVMKRKEAVRFGWLIALGIAGSIYLVIGLVIGKQAPSGMPGSLPYIGVPSVALLIFGLWKYFAARGDLFVTKGKGNALGVTIMASQSKKALEFYSPFRMTTGWEYINAGRGHKIYKLFIIFRNENNECLLSLEGGNHAVHGKPDGWKELSNSQLGTLTNEYSCSHMSELAKVIRPHIK